MRKTASLLCLVVFASTVNCDSTALCELSGQLFIVTKGAESIKLGLVEVAAIPEKDVLAFIAKKKAELEQAKATLREKYETASKACDHLHKKHYKELMSLGDASGVSTSEFDRVSAEQDIEFKIALQEMSRAHEEYLRFPTGKYFFEGLPAGVSKATPDADGKFLMKIPRKERYVLAAHASRQVLDEREQYYWLVAISLHGAVQESIMLSNNNLFVPDVPSPSK